MSESENKKIIRELSTLHTKVDGINRRLDISNGRIAKNEELIESVKLKQALDDKDLIGLLEDKKEEKQNKQKLKWLTIDNVFKVITSVLLTVILYYLAQAGIK